jgi:hypothetical protein
MRSRSKQFMPLLSCMALLVTAFTSSHISGSEEALTADTSVHRWAARLAQGERITLDNPFGDIRVRASGDSGLDLSGVVQLLNGEKRNPDFRTERRSNALAISVHAPDGWNGRVDVGVRVPAGSHLDLKTVSGLIEVSGNIHVRTGGRVEAYSDSGDILVSMGGTDFEDHAGTIESQAGNIDLWLHPLANIGLYASAGGELDIKTGPTIEKTTEGAARLVLGSGAGRLDVSSSQGTVIVQTLPVAGLTNIENPSD